RCPGLRRPQLRRRGAKPATDHSSRGSCPCRLISSRGSARGVGTNVQGIDRNVKCCSNFSSLSKVVPPDGATGADGRKSRAELSRGRVVPKPWLVHVDEVGAGRRESARLVVDDAGKGMRERLDVAVEVVVRLLGERKRPRQRHLHRSVCVPTEEGETVELDRL